MHGVILEKDESNSVSPRQFETCALPLYINVSHTT